MDTAAKKADRSLDKLDNEIADVGKASKRADGQVSRLNRELQELSANATIGGVSLRTLGTAGAGLFIFDKIIDSITAVRREVAELEPITKTLREFSSDLASDQEFLLNTADRLGQSYKGLSSSYSNLLLQYRSGTITLEQSKKLLEGFAASAALTGASNEAVSRSMVGLTQSLTSGVVQVDEFRQITENLAVTLPAVARGMGITTAEVQRLVKTGQLGSQELVAALVSGFNETVDSAEDAANGIGAAWSRAGTEFTQFAELVKTPVGAIEIGIATAIRNALSNVNFAIEESADAYDRYVNRFSDVSGEKRVLAIFESVVNGAELGRAELENLKEAAEQIGVAIASLSGDNGLAAKLAFDVTVEGGTEEAIERLRKLKETADELQTTATEQIRIDVLTDGFDQAAENIQTRGDKLLADLFPESKVNKLKDRLAEAVDLEFKGGLSSDEFVKVEKAIQAQIKKQKESTEEYKNNKKAIDERTKAEERYQAILGRTNPNIAAQNNYDKTVKQLNESMSVGAIGAIEYEGTIQDLDRALERTFADIKIDKARDLQDVLSNPDIDNSAIRDYEDSMLLLNRAMEDTPEKADAIQAAIARLNQDFLSGGSQNRSPTDDIQAQFDERLRVLRQYKQSEYADIEAADARILTLEENRNAALLKSEFEQNAERLAQSQNFTNSLIRQNEADSAFRRDTAINAGTGVERAEAAHQERLAKIREFSFNVETLNRQYQNGEISLTEYHTRIEELETGHQERLAGIKSSSNISQFDNEIQLGNQLFDIFEQSLSRKSDRALRDAKDARKLADNATGAEKEALEEQAVQAEAYARARFDKEKRAGIAQARVQQALAVVKAWTSGATIYDQIINAGIAFAGTESVIQDLKSQQFNGGSPVGGGGGGSTSGSSGNTGGNQINGQTIGDASNQPIVVNVVSADELINPEKLKDKYKGITRQMIEDGELEGATLNALT